MNQRVRPYESVTVFGGATLDRVARSDAPPVMGASNPGTVRHLAGGVGLNVATVLARLSFPTRMVTAVGDDAAGEAIVAAAKGAGVDTSAMSTMKGKATAGYHATLDDRGNLIVGIADMQICEAITPAAIAAAITATGERDFWVVDANLPEATLAFLVAEATAARRPVAALSVSPAKAVRLIPILDDLSFLFANRKEAATLIGYNPDETSHTAAALAGELAGHRATRVVVTNGTQPLAVAGGGEARSFMPLRTEVKGVNGAGDSLAAGTILGLVEGLSLQEAIRFGLAAAAMMLEAGSILATSFSQDALAERIGAGPNGRARIAS